MNNINEEYIEKYIQDILPERPDFLKELEDYAYKEHIPIIHPEVAQFLKVILNIKKPLEILELGTAMGYSALVMACSTGRKTNITTIEKRKDMIGMAKQNIEISPYKYRIKIIEGDAKKELCFLPRKYDFIFLDAGKGHYLDFFKSCTDLLNNGGIIVSDNVLYKGMVANDKLVVRRKKTIVKRMRSYLEYISDLDGYITSILPLGDGVSITYKKEEEN